MDLVIFDLDGTLIDSRLDLAHAVNAMLRHLGRTTLDNERVYSYVGNGAPMLVRRAMGDGATEAQVQEGLEYFLEYYRDHALDNTGPYPGVRESVERLHDAGIGLAVLTNKPVRISRTIIEGLGMGPFFRQVYGGNSFDFKKPHPIGVQTLMAECGATREKTLMVGDSSVDVQTARNAGVKCAAVTYGFQPESLADPAPDLLMDRMDDVAGWVLAQQHGVTR